MAKTTTLIDDMDGSTGAKERYFSINGTNYAMDLTDENFSAFLKTNRPWIDIARVARKPRKQAHRPLTSEERKALRRWAAINGIQLAERGRFPNEVVAEFLAQHDVGAWLDAEPEMAGLV